MRFKFFHIPSSMPSAAADELNHFVATHRVVHVEKHFTADNEGSWSFCVTYMDQNSASGTGISKGKAVPKVDYKDVLTAPQFEVYSQLRELRKQLAESDGTPVYAVATNEQLAEIVRRPVSSLTGLGKIPGFGKAKVDRHGTAIVKLMESQIKILQSASEDSSIASNPTQAK